jgi:hypothetical protein
MTCNPFECLAEYGCDDVKNPIDGAIFSPFVRLYLGSTFITNGNESSPNSNHAAISSFEYGFQPGSIGFGANFEIIDQGGTMYKQIVDAINKTATLAEEENRNISFDFGWIIQRCDSPVPQLMVSEERIYGLITKVDQTFEGGNIKLKFKLEAPGTATTAHTDLANTIGADDDKVNLKNAIRELFTEHTPRFEKVTFEDQYGKEEFEFAASDGGKDGPRSSWPVNQQNQITASRSWLNGLTTKDGNGILITYNPCDGSICFKEKPTTENCCASSLATYIVNGGNCSPVLEFNPSITWGPFGNEPGRGGIAGSNDGSCVYMEPTVEEKQKAGTKTSATVNISDSLWRTPQEQAEKTAQAVAAHLEANSSVEVLPGFNAELKIHGDPTYYQPLFLIGRTISIVVINPFHVNDKCTWIASPNCNPVLSNKAYMIHGVSHQISGGSYVTTMTLFLATPNKQVPHFKPLGGLCGNEVYEDTLGRSEATDTND